MADDLKKLDDTTLQITLQAPTQNVTLDQLQNQAIQTIGQIQRLQLDLARIQKLISDARKLGVKTQSEVLAAQALNVPESDEIVQS